MSITFNLYRNANRNNILTGAYPSGNAPAIVSGEDLFLTTDRLTAINARITADSTLYDYMVGRCNTYLNADPYNKWEYMCAYALSWRLGATTTHRDYGIELFNDNYNTTSTGGWLSLNGGYTSRNGFRTDALWCCLFVSWMKDDLAETDLTRALNNMEMWGAYWVDYVDGGSARISDTDEITSLTANLAMIAAVLKNEGRAYGSTLELWLETFRQNYLFDQLLDGYFAGGMWGEGRDYSIGTMAHMGDLYLSYSEILGTSLPDSYLINLIDGIIYNTLADYNGFHTYGDVQTATDYLDLSSDSGRFYNTMMMLEAAVTDSDAKAAANYWLAQVRSRYGRPDTASDTAVLQVIFDKDSAGSSPTAQSKPTAWSASGTGFVSVRSDWTTAATQYFGWAAAYNVDHQTASEALSFNLARNSVWLSKAVAGYYLDADTASSHGTASNTILIENADPDGRSSPTLRPVSNGDLLNLANTATFAYHAWEAADAYNMSGYYATSYADLVARQIACIKPDLLIVYDHTITDPTQVADLVQYKAWGGGNKTRYVKVIQHFQVEPTLSGGYYVAADAGQEINHKVILPASPTITTVDESVIWATQSEAETPANQRKWHLEIEAASVATENEFVSVIAVGDTGAVVKPVSETTFTTDGGDAIGVLLNYNSEWHCIVFPKDPRTPLTSVVFNINATVTTETVNYYVSGLSDVAHTISAVNGVVSVTQGAGTTASNSVLEF